MGIFIQLTKIMGVESISKKKLVILAHNLSFQDKKPFKILAYKGKKAKFPEKTSK